MKKLLLDILTAVLFCSNVLASSTAFWEVSRLSEIERGDAKNVAISSEGRMRVAPQLVEVFNTEQPLILCSAVDSKGNLYLGTGHEGRVYKVDWSGKSSLFFDSSELDVTALVVGEDDVIYAATSPDGKVYKIVAGQATEFFDPEDKYIWSLAFEDKHVYVGTGEKGALYRVTLDGKAALYGRVSDKHVMCLTSDRRGGLLLGTEPSGLLLRTYLAANEAKFFALTDSPLREIHQIAVAADGTIYALALSVQSSPDRSLSSATSATGGDSSSGSVTVIFEDEVVASSSTASSTSSGSTAVKSLVYKITPSGAVDVIWSSKDSVAFALLLSRDRVLVGTGTKGRIYSIDPKDKTFELIAQSSEEQTSTLIEFRDVVYFTSNNIGKLFRIDQEAALQGEYVSYVFDAKVVSKWGAVSWRGMGDLQIMTRCGNTEVPDNTWSEWQEVEKTKLGYEVAGPEARFVQWKAVLQRGSVLYGLKIAYLQHNLAPSVSKIVVLQPGVALQEVPQQPLDPGILAAGLDPAMFGFPATLQPRKVFQKGARSLQWTAEDPNGDSLSYAIYYSQNLEGPWHLVAKDLQTNYYTLDSDALADGKYYFKVVASDENSNPAESSLSGFQITEEVVIDNTPPKLTASKPVFSGDLVEIAFTASDENANIRRAQFSVDGGPWKTVFPEDGIADSKMEVYRIKTKIADGVRFITLRCYDDNVNSTALQVELR
ncbi:MAG: hypothetical protein RMM17_13820 [Acidobacteriota bacterium]|nr:hypothetical protein [Blastocatellia bacterium]MDW8413745.1 hypothetical protein [Acidobacteriota bacterium]